MNYSLTPSQIAKLIKMGYFRERRAPRKAVLVMPRDPAKGAPVVIDENGYVTMITVEHACEL